MSHQTAFHASAISCWFNDIMCRAARGAFLGGPRRARCAVTVRRGRPPRPPHCTPLRMRSCCAALLPILPATLFAGAAHAVGVSHSTDKLQHSFSRSIGNPSRYARARAHPLAPPHTPARRCPHRFSPGPRRLTYSNTFSSPPFTFLPHLYTYTIKVSQSNELLCHCAM